LKTYRNALGISLAIILVLYLVLFGTENFWKVLITHFMFLALFPFLVFVNVFSKMIPLKEDISVQGVYEKLCSKKCNFTHKSTIYLLLFLSGTDFLFDGFSGFVNGWLTWWSFAAAEWLILLVSYSYQVYINPSNKPEEPIKNPQADS